MTHKEAYYIFSHIDDNEFTNEEKITACRIIGNSGILAPSLSAEYAINREYCFEALKWLSKNVIE
jgi:hypothetical protein